MTLFNRRTLVKGALALSLTMAIMASGPAVAADYPDQPIDMLVGYGAGGQTDLVARAAAYVMSKQLGQPINVINKPGVGGAVAARELGQAKADGYTILFNSNALINLAPFVMKNADFKPDQFDYVGMITAFQLALAAPKDAPFNTIAEYVEWAKKNPGSSYAALAPEARLYITEIMKKNGIQVNIVPVQSGSEVINGLLGGQLMLAYSGGIHYRYPDQIKSIAATTTFRHPSAPDVPTVEEQGYPLGMDTRTTVIVPKGTPKAIIDKLAMALKACENDPDFKKVADAVDIPIQYLEPAAATKEMADSTAKNKVIMENAGIIAR
ncbi:tripartite tricarboxylate transporter substrate binding protein [Mesorhizobium sp. BE184]|uniref:Bug family tripartite tricarboxylate transporter substrate binding protein n=1 Tax=Mesorhizobium sp. BE184 TaxID=2817714 RepID=UPI0028584CF5|nr:tripartite tricarboxylate transporter substrate binding protein [Mesorhizobium sp. BE184]MDR7033869.1 tripartite-type tricarboxylate transporter receptor subunit TctC [Mesorhizobium sp. BE184]